MPKLHERLQNFFGPTYAIERELGGGGMSRVFLAEETALGRQVVIKVLPPDMAAGVNRERFELETQLAASLQHPLIVPILTAGSAAPAEPDLLYYVMPFIDGLSLRERIDREGELPVQEGARILRDVADALARAHTLGVVHRDIKPDNVMLSGKHAMVTDFGIAKALAGAPDPNLRGLTQMGMSLGTPMYMSPEQAAGDPNVDHRADIYSFGVMAYEMFTGHLPFEAETAQGLLAAHISETPRPIRERRPSLPAPLADAIMRCLEKKPADRWQSSDQLSSMLDDSTGTSGALTPATTQSINVDAFVTTRSPVRVGGTFIGVGALLLGVAYLLMMQLGLPDWTFQGTFALTLAAIILATLGAARGGAGWTGMRRGLTGAFGLFAAAIVVYLAMRALGIGPVGTLVAAGVMEERGRMVLAEFDNATNDPTLAETVTELLRIDIAQSPTITLVDLPMITSTLQRMQRDPTSALQTDLAVEVAERADANAVLTGDIRSVGSDLVISARLVATATGETLAAIRETARDGAVIDAIDRLSAALREKIGESLKTIRADAPLAEVTTGSTEALRLYAQAEMANNQADQLRAIELLDQAIAVDSTFAMAHRKLAIVLSNRNLEPERAEAAFTRAFELRDRLTERERYLADAAYYTYVGDSVEASIDAYETLLGKYPSDRIGLNNLAVNYRSEGRMGDAEVLYRRSIAQGGAPTVTFTNAIQVQYALGMLDTAHSTLARFAEDYPTHPALLNYRLAFSNATFDHESARELLDSLADDPTGIPQVDVGLRFERANLVAIGGKLAEFRKQLLAGYDAQADAGLQFVRQPRALFEAIVDAQIMVWFRDDPTAAAAMLDVALGIVGYDALPSEQRDDIQISGIYARAGRIDRARELIEMHERVEQPESIQDRSAALWYAHGMISLMEERYEDALSEFREARTAATACALCFLPEMGEGWLAAGQVDSAIVAFESYLETPSIFRSNQDNFNLWTVLFGLGQAYRRAGRIDDAVEAYDRLLNQWANAEPMLDEMIEDIRSRVAEMVGENATPR